MPNVNPKSQKELMKFDNLLKALKEHTRNPKYAKKGFFAKKDVQQVSTEVKIYSVKP